METIKWAFLELVSVFGYGFSIVLIIAFIVLLVLGNRFVKQFTKEIVNFIHGKAQNDLQHGLAFQKLDYLQLLVQKVHTPCRLRKAIYIDIMGERVRVLKEDLLRFIKQDLTKFSQPELQVEVLNLLDTVHLKFKTTCIQKGIPESVINKMDDTVFATRESYLSQIKLFCFSDYIYGNNIDRMRAFLDVICLALQVYMNTFEQILSSFNGAISEMNYHGVTCEHCKVCVHTEYMKKLKSRM